MRKILPGLLLLAVLFPAPGRAAELSVFAAASLTDALREISALYIKEGGDKLVLNLGASSMLARQIQEGAPADLFLSADEEKMNGLEKRKLLLPGTRRSVLSNTLVVVVPEDSSLKITGPKDLASPSIRALALAEVIAFAAVWASEYFLRRERRT
jgi:molybdate transport system substrate-binding protein